MSFYLFIYLFFNGIATTDTSMEVFQKITTTIRSSNPTTGNVSKRSETRISESSTLKFTVNTSHNSQDVDTT